MSDHDHSNVRTGIDRRTALKGGAAGLGLLALGGLGAGSAAADNGADKVFASGESLQAIDLDTQSDGDTSQSVSLLSGSIKTSTPTDLIMHSHVESALWTDLKVKGPDDAEGAMAQVEVWVEIDGVVVPLSTDSADPANGRTVFNHRDFEVNISNLDDDDELAFYLRTRSTNGFNWTALNLGESGSIYDSSDNVHEIELLARVTVDSSADGRARAMIGPRSLIAVPTKLANHAEV